MEVLFGEVLSEKRAPNTAAKDTNTIKRYTIPQGEVKGAHQQSPGLSWCHVCSKSGRAGEAVRGKGPPGGLSSPAWHSKKGVKKKQKKKADLDPDYGRCVGKKRRGHEKRGGREGGGNQPQPQLIKNRIV